MRVMRVFCARALFAATRHVRSFARTQTVNAAAANIVKVKRITARAEAL